MRRVLLRTANDKQNRGSPTLGAGDTRVHTNAGSDRALGPSTTTLLRAIHEAAQREKAAGFLYRACCVMLVEGGMPAADAAQRFGVSPRSVERWLQRYRTQGVDGLRDTARSGRASRLSPTLLSTLADELARPPRNFGYPAWHWNGPLLARHLADRHALSFSIRQCQRLLLTLSAMG